MKKIFITLLVCLSMLIGLAITALPGATTAQAHSIAPVAGQRGKPHLFSSRSAHKPELGSGNLQYHSGPIQQNPKVYITYWGWNTDPYGEAAYLERLLSGVGGSTWLNTVTEYNDSIRGYITNPSAQFKGSWYDNGDPLPANPSDAQIAQEAVVSMAHFGYDPDATYFVATPTGHSSPGFGTQFCAYHNRTTANNSVVDYVNLPYIPDAGYNCGMYSVNSGSAGYLDGVSIVTGHELAEVQTDPQLNAWYDSAGYEIGDKCAWTGLQNITLNTGTFAMQPLWDNNFNNGTGGCVQFYWVHLAVSNFYHCTYNLRLDTATCSVTLTATASSPQVVSWTESNDYAIGSNPSSGTLQSGQSTVVRLGPFPEFGYTFTFTFTGPSGAIATITWNG